MLIITSIPVYLYDQPIAYIIYCIPYTVYGIPIGYRYVQHNIMHQYVP